MSLLAQVADRLTQVDVRFALIGAGALAAHGVTRSTFDLDLLATDPRCLELDTWSPLPGAIDREVRRGDLEDPMAGLVRFTAAGERDIDLVVGRAAWQDEILGRSRPARIADAQIPIVEAAPQAAATGLRDGQRGQPAWTLCGRRLTCGIVSDGVGEPLMASRGVGQFSHLVEASLGGIPLSRDDAFSVLGTQDRDVTKLLEAAFAVRAQYFGRKVKICVLQNARSGLCPEDCHYCSQSAISRARIPKYRLLAQDELLEGARRAVAAGARRYCMVASGRGPAEADIQHLTQAARAIKRQFPDLELCLSLGLTSEDQARALKAAGVGWVNHNLNTSRRFYPAICSTHTYDDRVETVRNVRRAGLMTCSGGIIGMGESDEDVVDMAFAVRELEVDSIPVNFLHPIPGTPLADVRRLSPAQGLKALCLFRFLNPRSEIRMAAGREEHLKDSQFLALYAANSIFVEGYLTTPGQKAEDAKRMIVEAGFEIEGETV